MWILIWSPRKIKYFIFNWTLRLGLWYIISENCFVSQNDYNSFFYLSNKIIAHFLLKNLRAQRLCQVTEVTQPTKDGYTLHYLSRNRFMFHMFQINPINAETYVFYMVVDLAGKSTSWIISKMKESYSSKILLGCALDCQDLHDRVKSSHLRETIQ